MRLWDWLVCSDARLDITLSCHLDPIDGEVEWRCDISGFPDPTDTRPAVYLKVREDPVSAVAGNPEDAFRDAVHKLRGVKVHILSKGAVRDETLTFPQDLTV